MNVQFEIESILNTKGHEPYVVARMVNPGKEFTLGTIAFLNQIEIKPYFVSPRALDESGNPRFDLFIFYPAKAKDIQLFSQGMTVELT
jgi:hypothetical protein